MPVFPFARYCKLAISGLLILCFYGCICGWAETPVKITAVGTIFNDGNRNGQQDSGENGVGGVSVSDGIRITKTDTQGRYRLADISPAGSRFVFISTPAGYTAWDRFYCRVPSSPTNIMTANFALWPLPASSNDLFKFAQITDIHIGRNKTGDVAEFIDDLREIEALAPDFIIATGDLVSSGADESQFVQYKSVRRQLKTPLVSVMGNHDCMKKGKDYFENHLGPAYYSFDYGRKHFIILNCCASSKEQEDWLKQDLMDQQAAGKDALVFQHYPPAGKLLSMLQQFKTQAIFSGHWHSTRVVSCGNVLSVNTPSLRFGGIDLSPRGFQLVTCRADKIILDSRYSGCKQLCVLIAPADGVSLPVGVIPFHMVAYDSSTPVTNVEYQLNNSAWNRMMPQNKFCWQAQEKCSFPGTNQVKIKVHFSNATVLERQSTFTVATAGSLPVPEPGENWPMFHRDAGRTGATEEDVVPPLYLAWFRTLGGTIHVSSPVVEDGIVYIGVADEENKGQAGIYALDGVTGSIKWRYATVSSIRHTVAVDTQRCYGITIDGMVIALDKATGKLIWQYSLGNEMERLCSRWAMAAPLVYDNTVYAGVAPYFVALEATTGKEIWRAPNMGGDWISSLTSPSGNQEHIYVGFNWGKGLFALDRKNGLPVWNNKYRYGYASPVCSGGRLYYCGQPVCALEPQSGACIWSNDMGIVVSTPAIVGDILVIGRGNGQIQAIDGATGRKIWEYRSPRQAKLFSRPYARTESPIISSPVIAGQIVYCGGTDGQLMALDLQSGKLLWNYDLGSPITSSPAVSGNTVYIAAFDGTVYAFTTLCR